MVNMNEIISNNIINIMKQNGKKQIDLAGYLGVSKQIVSKMGGAAREGFDRTARAFDALRHFALQKGFALPFGLSDPAKLSLCFGARGDQAGEFGAHLRIYGVEPEYISVHS